MAVPMLWMFGWNVPLLLATSGLRRRRLVLVMKVIRLVWNCPLDPLLTALCSPRWECSYLLEFSFTNAFTCPLTPSHRTFSAAAANLNDSSCRGEGKIIFLFHFSLFLTGCSPGPGGVGISEVLRPRRCQIPTLWNISGTAHARTAHICSWVTAKRPLCFSSLRYASAPSD